MDKPQSLSVKDFIIRNMSTKTMLSERCIEDVINHQFESAHTAMSSCDSLEFSGWGKLLFNQKKAKKKMEKFLSQKELFTLILADNELTTQKRHSTELKLQTALKNIEFLKPKLK